MHCVGGQRGGRHHSVVGSVLEFSPPCLVSVLFTGPSLTSNEVFLRNFFPLVCTCRTGCRHSTCTVGSRLSEPRLSVSRLLESYSTKIFLDENLKNIFFTRKFLVFWYCKTCFKMATTSRQSYGGCPHSRRGLVAGTLSRRLAEILFRSTIDRRWRSIDNRPTMA